MLFLSSWVIHSNAYTKARQEGKSVSSTELVEFQYNSMPHLNVIIIFIARRTFYLPGTIGPKGKILDIFGANS